MTTICQPIVECLDMFTYTFTPVFRGKGAIAASLVPPIHNVHGALYHHRLTLDTYIRHCLRDNCIRDIAIKSYGSRDCTGSAGVSVTVSKGECTHNSEYSNEYNKYTCNNGVVIQSWWTDSSCTDSSN